MTTTPVTDPSDAPDQETATETCGRSWFGLVRAPVPGVEVTPIVWSRQMGPVTIEEFAREWVVEGVAMAELWTDVQARGDDNHDRYYSDRLEQMGDAYEALAQDADRLTVPSLERLTSALFELAADVGHEWRAQTWGDPVAFENLWREEEEGRRPDVSVHDWVVRHVLDAQSRPKVPQLPPAVDCIPGDHDEADPRDSGGPLSGASSPDTDETPAAAAAASKEALLASVHELVDGLGRVALAALGRQDGYKFRALLKTGPSLEEIGAPAPTAVDTPPF